GGTWDAADNGSYTFRLQPSQVSDLAGNFAASRMLGPLNVLLFGPTLAPDLLPASDTGSSSADDVTNFDNSSHDRALRFSVGNTFPGATVTIYADGTPIGIAVTEAGSAATVVTTNGTVPLPSGY